MKESEAKDALSCSALLPLLLMLTERMRFMTKLKRSELNPAGIGSHELVKRAAQTLVRLGWASEKREGKNVYVEVTARGQKTLDCVRNNLP